MPLGLLALVQWLLEATHEGEVLSLNPSTRYLMYNLSHLFGAELYCHLDCKTVKLRMIKGPNIICLCEV